MGFQLFKRTPPNAYSAAYGARGHTIQSDPHPTQGLMGNVFFIHKQKMPQDLTDMHHIDVYCYTPVCARTVHHHLLYVSQKYVLNMILSHRKIPTPATD